MSYKTYEVRVYSSGIKHWYLNGKLHREDGPAIEYSDGEKHWYLDGKRHREDGPAIEYPDGEKHWYLDGKCYREDGPAIEYSNGNKYWYLDGKRLTEKEFNSRVKDDCSDKIVEIDGKKYKLQLVE